MTYEQQMLGKIVELLEDINEKLERTYENNLKVSLEGRNFIPGSLEMNKEAGDEQGY